MDVQQSVKSADDFDSVRSALADAGGVAMALWISYLFFLFYLAVAAGVVTHGDLLFENRVKLPVLNVDLPLVAFFTIAPLLFVLLHLYLFIHFDLLANKAHLFDEVLRNKLKNDPQVRDLYRLQLPINIFVQYLSGRLEKGDPKLKIEQGSPHLTIKTKRMKLEIIHRLLLWLIIHLPMLVASIILLLFFQIQFLPYRNETVMYWHTLLLGAILFVSWWYWPPRNRMQRTKRVGAALGTFATILLSLIVTIPWSWFGGRDFLFHGNLNPLRLQRASLFSDTLVLPDLQTTDPTKHSMRGRDLTGAILTRADLQNFDFVCAKLVGGDLRNVKFKGADLTGADLTGATLDGADLAGAIYERGITKLPDGFDPVKAGMVPKRDAFQEDGARC